MILRSDTVVLEPISAELARRIVARAERPGDAWHPDYPFEDEIAPLRALAEADADEPDPRFGMHLLRRVSDGLAVGGIGFSGPPDERGSVELGYGLVASARRAGLATEAVRLAVQHASLCGARRAVADTERDNVASQRVLLKNGFAEVGRRGSLLLFARDLGTSADAS